MSQENVEIVRQAIEAWNSFFKDGTDPIAALREFCDPDITVDLSRRLIDAETYVGYQGAQRFLEQLREPWEDFQIEPERFMDTDNKVVVFSRVVGNAKQTGINIDSTVGHVCTLRDGKLIRIDYFGEDRGAALEAVGLSQ